MKENFTENEQKWYIANLYIYLHYDFCINLEDVYKLIGFIKKGNAKSTLVNNFEENIDYKILLLRTQKQTNSDRGGHNNEQILLNIDTFKNLCMLSKTDNGKQIRKYYIKLETIYNEIIKEEFELYKNQIKDKDEQIKQLEIDNDNQKHDLILKEYLSEKVIYILRIHKYDDLNYIIKIGSTKDINNRITEHKRSYGKSCVLLDCFKVKDNVGLEMFLHSKMNQTRVKDYPNHEHEKELFKLSKNFTYSMLIKIIKENIDDFNYIKSDTLEYKKIDTLQKMLSKDIPIENVFEKIDNTLLNHIEKLFYSYFNSFKEEILTNIKELYYQNQTTEKNDFGEVIASAGPKLYKIHPETLTIEESYDTVAKYLKAHPDSSRSSLMKTIKENGLYKGYRWCLLDRDKDISEITINETIKTKPKKYGYIAKLNKDKTHIINVYLTKQIASCANGGTYTSLDNPVKNNTLFKDCYYIWFNDCNDILKNEYIQKYGNPILFKDKVGIAKIDQYTNEILSIYKDAYQCALANYINERTLAKAIINNELYKGYYYKRLPEKIIHREIED